jgi:DNA-binding transcriptional ArsR family regulator
MDDAAVRVRVVADLRDNPGKSPTRLGRTLGIYHRTLGRHLRELVDDGMIRIEERRVGFGRQRHRACFLAEHINPAAAESLAGPREAMA